MEGLTTTEPPSPGTTPTTTVSLPIGIGGVDTTFNDVYAGTSLLLSGSITANILSVFVDGAGTTTITGQISGSGGLSKNGPGTLDVFPAGANGSTYTGSTTLNDGITVIDNNNSLGANGASGILVYSGATLETLGTRTIAESVGIQGYGVAGPIPGTSLGAIDATGSRHLQRGRQPVQRHRLDRQSQRGHDDGPERPAAAGGLTLTWNTNGPVVVSAAIMDGTGFSPKGTVVFNGPGLNGKFTLSASNTYGGSTIVDSGTVTLTRAAR